MYSSSRYCTEMKLVLWRLGRIYNGDVLHNDMQNDWLTFKLMPLHLLGAKRSIIYDAGCHMYEEIAYHACKNIKAWTRTMLLIGPHWYIVGFLLMLLRTENIFAFITFIFHQINSILSLICANLVKWMHWALSICWTRATNTRHSKAIRWVTCYFVPD